MANAVLKLSQGVTVGAPAVAILGTTGSPVTLGNGDDDNVLNWKYELLDVPSTSAVATGVLSDGATPTAAFTPDVRGCYLARVTTTDGFNKRRRSAPLAFGVLELSGRLIPPHGAFSSSLNFAGQVRGWAKYMEEWLRRVDKTRELASVNVSTTPVALPAGIGAPRHLLARVLTDTISGPSALTLPASPVLLDSVTVKDVDGTAAANPVTVSGAGGALIDGSATFLINVNRGVLRAEWDGTGWMVT